MTYPDVTKVNLLDEKRRKLSQQAQEVAGLEDLRDNVMAPRWDSVEKFLREQVAPIAGAPFRALAERYPQQAQSIAQSPITQNLLKGLGAYSRYVAEPAAELGGRVAGDVFGALVQDLPAGRPMFWRTPEFVQGVAKRAQKTDLLSAVADFTDEVRYKRDSFFMGERVLGSLIADPLNFIPTGAAFKTLAHAGGVAVAKTAADRAAMKLGLMPDTRGLIGKALTFNNASVANYTEGLVADTVTSFALPHMMKTARPNTTIYGQLKDFIETPLEKLNPDIINHPDVLARQRFVQGIFKEAKILDRIDETMLPEDVLILTTRAAQEWVRRKTGQLYNEVILTRPSAAPVSVPGKLLKGLGAEAPTEIQRMTPDVFKAEMAAGVAANDPIWLAIRDATAAAGKDKLAATSKLRDMGVRIQEVGQTKQPNAWYRLNQRIRSEFSVLWLNLNPGWHIGNYSTNMLSLGLEGGFREAGREGFRTGEVGLKSVAKLMGIKTEIPRFKSYAETQGIRSLEQQATFGQVLQATGEEAQLKSLLATGASDTIIERFLKQLQTAQGGKQSTVESFMPKFGRDFVAGLRAAGSVNENSAKRALFDAVVRETDLKNLRSSLAAVGYIGPQADNIINLVVQHGREGAMKRLGVGVYDAADLINWEGVPDVVAGHLKTELEAAKVALKTSVLTAEQVLPILQKVRGIVKERGQTLSKLGIIDGTMNDVADLGEEALQDIAKAVTLRKDLDAAGVQKTLDALAEARPVFARQREMALISNKFERVMAPYLQTPAHKAVALKYVDESQEIRRYVQLQHFMLQERHVARLKELTLAGRADEVARENKIYALQTNKLFEKYKGTFDTLEKEFDAAMRKAGAPVDSINEATKVAATMPPVHALTSPSEAEAKALSGWAFNTDRETVGRIIKEAGLPDVVNPANEPTLALRAKAEYGAFQESIDKLIGGIRNPTVTAPPKVQELEKIRRALEGSRVITQQQAVVRTEGALFNYGLNTNLDFALNHIAPFPFWSTRTLLSMTLRVGANPQNLMRVARLAKIWYEDSKDKPRSAFMAEKVYTMPDGTEILWRPYTTLVPMMRPMLELIHEGSDPNEVLGWKDLTMAFKQMTGLNPYFYTELALGHVFGTEATGFGVFRSPEQMVKDLIPQQRAIRGLVGQVEPGAKFLQEGPLNILTSFSAADKYRFVYTIRDAVRTDELTPQQAEVVLQSIADGKPTDLAYSYIARAMREDSKRLFGTVTEKGPLPGAFFGTAIVPIRVSQQEAREVFNRYFEVDANGVPKLNAMQKEEIRKEFKHLFVGRSFLPPADLPASGPMFKAWHDTADYWYQVEQMSEKRKFEQTGIDQSNQGKQWIEATQELNEKFRNQKLALHDSNNLDAPQTFPTAAISTQERLAFDAALGKKAKPEHPLDAGYHAFVEILASPEYRNALGEPDYNKLNAAIDSYEKAASPEQLKYNRARLERDRTDKERAYYQAREDTKPYWEAWKSLPENLQQAYVAFQDKAGDDKNKADAMLITNPYLRLALKLIAKRREYLAKSDMKIQKALGEFWDTGPAALAERRQFAFSRMEE